jgi:hypothetical protein
LTAASQGDFSSTDAFLKSTLKGEDRLYMDARGDLNSDGLEDWVGVIERKKPNTSRTSQLYVLVQLRQGGYRVAEKSKEEEIAGTGCCYVESLEIRNSSIYIQNNAKADNTMDATTHQFKLYQGKWRLIGIKTSFTDFNSHIHTDTDMNLLTGAVIEKKQKGDEGKPITRSRRKKFAASFLKDFDFDTWFGTGRSRY